MPNSTTQAKYCPLYLKKPRLNFPPLLWLLVMSMLLSSLASFGQTITGTVFRDYNTNGTYESIADPTSYTYGEPGVGGVTVTAYNAAGVAVATTTTNSGTVTAALGTYTLTVNNSNAYRIEFTNLISGDYEAFRGTGSATSVQFVNGGATNVNLGINYPADYCQSVAPQLVTTCFVAANAATASTAITARPAMVGVSYTVVDLGKTVTDYATIGEIGAAWGVAYKSDTKQLFSSAFTKRHVGFSAGGPNAIYVTTVTSATSGNTTTFFNFTTVGGSAVTSTTEAHGNDLPTSSASLASYDVAAFDAVGKTSLGGMDLSDDNKTLYVVNLKDRNLYAIDVATKTYSSLAIPNPGCTTSGTVVNGSYRPFAVKYHRGKVYVGVVCTREDLTSTTAAVGYAPTAGLSATVYEVNPATSAFTTVLSFPLSYTKAGSNEDQSGQSQARFWRPWTSTYRADRDNGTDNTVVSYPQAWLTDIDFEPGTGDMVVGLRDRFGDQIGYRNHLPDPAQTSTRIISAISPGEILRARKCNLTDVAWTLENNGSLCGTTTPLSVTQAAAFGPGTGKYYWGDRVQNGSNHGMSSQGGIAQLAGSAKVAMTAIDPLDEFNTGGIKRLINATGAKDGNATGVAANPNAGAELYADDALGYGKANGLGGLDVLCNQAPIEIGNRVWLDTNNNGIQDPGEAPLAGVPVTLTGPGITGSVSVTTNAAGEYYFSNQIGTNTTGFVYSLTGLTGGGAYSLSFPASVSTASLSSKPNSATSATGNQDNIDTDPNAAGVISFTLGQSGQNNYSYDAGYVPCTPPSVTAIASGATTGSATICVGTAVNLSAQISPAGSYTYVWSAPAGVTLTGATTATATATGLPTGTATFTVTVSTSPVCSTTATVAVLVNPTPTASLSATQTTICAGQSTTLTASGGTTYRFSATGITSATATAIVSPTATTAYSVTVTNASGCSSTATVSVVVNPLPTLATSVSCNGLSTFDVSFTATAGASVTANMGTISGNLVTGIPSGQTLILTATLNGCSVSTQLTQNCEANAAGLGDYVFLDANKDGIQNTGDSPIEGVTVILYTNGVASATTVTSATGFYSFTGLTPGSSLSYAVGFTAPSGLTATVANAGSDDALDSDADIITGRTQSVTLAPNEFNPTLDAGFYAPVPVLSLDKFVDKSKASLGDILSYTIVVTNSGTTPATNVVVRDSTTAGLTYVVNSATAPAGTTFTSGVPISTWTIANLSVGQSLSLTFQAKADSSGILYNKATIPGDTATVCTSIPFVMCAGDSYAFTLTAPTGRSSYKWFKDNVEIIGQTTNVLEVTAPGTYSLAVDNVAGSCPDFSCCPFIVEEDTLPAFTVLAVPVTCIGNAPQANGKIVLSGFNAAYTYQYSLGSTFNSAASLSGGKQVIPTGGVIVSNLANPISAQAYTVRVYNASGCFTDVTVMLLPTVCGCPADVCVPYVISQTKRAVRIGDLR